jgi:cobalt/nickel transport system permease protein
MHDLLDDYAHANALRDVSPRLKLSVGLASILLSVSSPTPAAPLFVALSLSLATVLLAKIPARIYLQLLLLPFSFAGLSAAVVAFMHGSGDVLLSLPILGYSLGIREDGGLLALLLIARTLGGMCSLFFLSLTTPMIEIFAIFESLHMPQSVIELSMMIYRYIFVFLDQAAMIHNAQVMRLGDAGVRNRLQSFAMLCAVLFLRSWEQGERLIVAMDARCYDGKLELMEQTGRAGRGEVAAAATYLACALAVSALTWSAGGLRLL